MIVHFNVIEEEDPMDDLAFILDRMDCLGFDLDTGISKGNKETLERSIVDEMMTEITKIKQRNI